MFQSHLWGPPIFLLNGYHLCSQGIKWSGRVVDHSPPFNVDVKNEWSYTFMAWTGTALNFTFHVSVMTQASKNEYDF